MIELFWSHVQSHCPKITKKALAKGVLQIFVDKWYAISERNFSIEHCLNISILAIILSHYIYIYLLSANPWFPYFDSLHRTSYNFYFCSVKYFYGRNLNILLLNYISLLCRRPVTPEEACKIFSSSNIWKIIFARGLQSN